MRLKSLFFLVAIVGGLATQAQVNWISFEEALEQSKKEPKKILVDIYTDWCGYCKKMDVNTYSNKKLAAYINKHYYAVKFNAEQRPSVTFRGHEFKFSRGVHELALALTNNKPSYPTTVILTEELEIFPPIAGYLAVSDFAPMLHYYGDNVYKKQIPWLEFSASFEKSPYLD